MTATEAGQDPGSGVLSVPDPGASLRLDGHRALVTGASRGIGRAVALAFAGAGADVAVHYHTNRIAAGAVADAISLAGRRAPLLQANLAEPDGARRLAAAAERSLGPVDILVLNAAVHQRHPLADTPAEAFAVQVETGFRSALELCGVLVPPMSGRGFGRVIAIGSVQARRPHSQLAVYAAMKAALANLMRNLAKEWASHGITANVISPGLIDTDRNEAIKGDRDGYQALIASIPLGRVGEAGEVAPIALLLASPAGAYVTGADIAVDGGLGLP